MKRRRFPVMLSTEERQALLMLAGEDGLSGAAVVRRLVRCAARQRGLWPSTEARDAAQTHTAERKETQNGT